MDLPVGILVTRRRGPWPGWSQSPIEHHPRHRKAAKKSGKMEAVARENREGGGGGVKEKDCISHATELLEVGAERPISTPNLECIALQDMAPAHP